jgi:hypothetical protein
VRAKGLTYPEAVDEALCFGWIGGVRRSVDAESFSVRSATVILSEAKEQDPASAPSLRSG